MAYLIRKGTKVVVRKPSGELVEHRVREDCLFRVDEKVGDNRTLQFTRGGFLLPAWAADVTEVLYKCPECGKRVGAEGLCQDCRLKWLPR